ncbi:RluA family pseudouridine synthase [Cohnella suwonensis]|uniref:RNA pseudouridylate synthase n=1 Tax=Cohnella suwonensis TaxID=696072 RepID=A0ABW0LRY3_9BACL
MAGAGRNRRQGGPGQSGGERNGRRDRGRSGGGSHGGGRGSGSHAEKSGFGGRKLSQDRTEGPRQQAERTGGSYGQGGKTRGSVAGGGRGQAGTRPPRGSGGTGGPSGVRAAGGGQPSAGRGSQQGPILSMGRIKGEWMEIRLPDNLSGAPMAAIAKYLPLPPKLLSRLMQTRGCVLQGPHLRLHLFPREGRDFPSDWMELNILYEDEFTLVVNKPAGIEVHPSEKGQRKTLAHAVAAYYEMSGQDLRVRHVHRIDKDTTGPVLYAKNEFAHYQYDKAMREKEVERIYVALGEGRVEGNKGKIDKPIGQDRHHSTRRRISDTGDQAVTHYEVVERFDDHTLVRLRLETGRTHQIRVHMASINHPLAGDGLYGGKRGVMSRQALHGERLIWRHPWTGEKQQVTAPLPDDFAQALVKLRNDR